MHMVDKYDLITTLCAKKKIYLYLALKLSTTKCSLVIPYF